MATGSHCSHDAALQLVRLTNEELRREVSRIKCQLQSEHSAAKTLKRQKAADVKSVRIQEARRWQLIVNDLKTRLHHEREQSLQQQKDALTRKFQAEIGRIVHANEEELRRVRSEARDKQALLQAQLRDALRADTAGARQGQGPAVPAGNPGAAVGASSNETSKRLLVEVATLRGQKRKLEETLQTLSDADRRKVCDIHCLHEEHESEMTQLKKAFRQETHKLMEELKMKDRTISQMERELRQQTTRVQQQREILEELSNQQHKEGEQLVRDEATLREKKLQLKLEESQEKMRKLEETHGQEKKELISKLRETENMQGPLRQKNKQFVTRNMELSAKNRHLQDTVLRLQKESEKTKDKTDDTTSPKRRKRSRLPVPIAFQKKFSILTTASTLTSVSSSSPTSTLTSVSSSSSTSTLNSVSTSSSTSTLTSLSTSSPTSTLTSVSSSSPTSTLTSVSSSSPTSTLASVSSSSPTPTLTSAPTSSPTSTLTSAPTSTLTSISASAPNSSSTVPASTPNSVPDSSSTTDPVSDPISFPPSMPTSTADEEKLKIQLEEKEKTIEALRQAAREKDRRIEQLQMRHRKEQRALYRMPELQSVLESEQEVGDGEEPDSGFSVSEASEFSVSQDSGFSTQQDQDNAVPIMSPTLSNDNWNEFAKKEYENMYAQLSKEHQALQRSYQLLQTQIGNKTDPQREGKTRTKLENELFVARSKLQDMEDLLAGKGIQHHLVEEKGSLNAINLALTEKINELQSKRCYLQAELQECKDQNELLEFRVLELEESQGKTQTSGQTPEPPSVWADAESDTVSDSGIHSLPASEGDSLDGQLTSTCLEYRTEKVEEVKEKLHTLVKHVNSPCDKSSLLQAMAVLDVCESRITALQAEKLHDEEEEDRYKDKKEDDDMVKEREKQDNMVLELEETKQKLDETLKMLSTMKEKSTEQERSRSALLYKEEVYQKTDMQLRQQVTDLQTQLQSSLTGRYSETEMLQEKIHKITQLEKTIYDLNIRIRALQHDNTELNDELSAVVEKHDGTSVSTPDHHHHKESETSRAGSEETISPQLNVPSVTPDLNDSKNDRSGQHSRQSSGISCDEDKYDSLEQHSSFQESGIFDIEPCEFISQGTQTSCYGMEGELYAEIPSLTSEIEKLTKFREAVEGKTDKNNIPLKLGERQDEYLMPDLVSDNVKSVSSSDKLMNDPTDPTPSLHIDSPDTVCPDLEGLKSQCQELIRAKRKVDYELLASRNVIFQLQEQLKKFQSRDSELLARTEQLERQEVDLKRQEVDLKRQVQEMTDKVQQLVDHTKQLQEEKDELEEAENDARLKYQRLEETLSSMKEDKEFLMEELEEERRLVQQLRSEVRDLHKREIEVKAEIPYLKTLIQKYEHRIMKLEETEVELRNKSQFLQHSMTVILLMNYWKCSRAQHLALPSIIPMLCNSFTQTENVNTETCCSCVNVVVGSDACHMRTNFDTSVSPKHSQNNIQDLKRVPVNDIETQTIISDLKLYQCSCQKDKRFVEHGATGAIGTLPNPEGNYKVLSARIDTLTAADQSLQTEMTELLHMNVRLGEKLQELNSGVNVCQLEDKNYHKLSDCQPSEEEPVEKCPRVSLSAMERIDSLLSAKSDSPVAQTVSSVSTDKESYYLEQIDLLQKEKSFWRKTFEKEKSLYLDSIGKIDEEKKVLEERIKICAEEKDTLYHNLENLRKEKAELESSLMERIKNLEAEYNKQEIMHKYDKESITKDYEHRIDDLNSERQCYKTMVADLEGCLNTLRKELELVSVSKVPDSCNENSAENLSDTKTNWVNMKRKWRAASGRVRIMSDSKNQDVVLKIKELIRAETALRCKVYELEKKESAYNETLQEADRIMVKMESDYQMRVSELEISEQKYQDRINLLEENEQRLRQALKVNGRNSEVHKIGELLDRLMETEKSELQLKERIFQSEKIEKDLRLQMIEEQKGVECLKRELQDQEEIVERMMKLERENNTMAAEIVSMRDMKHHFQEVQQSEEFLKARVEELELTELSLKETLSQADNILRNREKKLKDQIKMLEEEVLWYKTNIHDIESSGEERRREDVLLKKEVEELKRRLGEAEVEIKEKAGHLEGNEVAFRGEVTKLRHQLSICHKQLNDLEAVNSCLREEIKSLQSQSLELSGQVEEQCKAEEQNTIKFNLQLLQKDSEIEELTEKLDDMISQQSRQDLDVLAEREGGMAAVATSVEEVVQDLQLCDTCVQQLGPKLRDAAHQLRTLSSIIRGEGGDHLSAEDDGYTWKKEQYLESPADAATTAHSSDHCIPDKQDMFAENLAAPSVPVHTLTDTPCTVGGSEVNTTASQCLDSDCVEDVGSNKTDSQKVWDLEERLCVAEKQVQQQEVELKLLDEENSYLQTRLESSEEEVRSKCRQIDDLHVVLDHIRQQNIQIQESLERQKFKAEKYQASIETYKTLLTDLDKKYRMKNCMISILADHIKHTTSSGVMKKFVGHLKQWMETVSLKTIPEDFTMEKLCTYFSQETVNEASQQTYVSRTHEKTLRERSPLHAESSLPPPFDFQVTRVVRNDTLILAWTPPNCQNVSGYEIFINGVLNYKVRSSTRTKAVINSLKLDTDLDISIISMSADGSSSEAVHTAYHSKKSNTCHSTSGTTQASVHRGSHVVAVSGNKLTKY